MSTRTAKSDILRKGRKLGAGGGDGEGGGKKYLRVKEGEPVTFAPIQPLNELISFDQHEYWETNPAVMIPCIGPGCPACKSGNKPKYKALLQVITPDEPTTPKILPMGISVNRQLEQIAEEIDQLPGAVFKLKRTGSGLTTRYTLVPTGKRVAVDKVIPLDIESEVQVFSADEITAKISAIGGKTEEADEAAPAKTVPAVAEEDWGEV